MCIRDSTKIVKNLNQQAKVLGYKDYSELSYVRMNRIGYGPVSYTHLVKDKLDMRAVQLHKLGFHQLCRVIVPGNADGLAGAAYGCLLYTSRCV